MSEIATLLTAFLKMNFLSFLIISVSATFALASDPSWQQDPVEPAPGVFKTLCVDHKIAKGVNVACFNSLDGPPTSTYNYPQGSKGRPSLGLGPRASGKCSLSCLIFSQSLRSVQTVLMLSFLVNCFSIDRLLRHPR